ncbi:MAG TPA: hypothetical protein VMV69_21415 [Pirellulales bacterium]|nr:hypothetical protein [Pirellulales bacterium]
MILDEGKEKQAKKDILLVGEEAVIGPAFMPGTNRADPACHGLLRKRPGACPLEFHVGF